MLLTSYNVQDTPTCVNDVTTERPRPRGSREHLHLHSDTFSKHTVFSAAYAP